MCTVLSYTSSSFMKMEYLLEQCTMYIGFGCLLYRLILSIYLSIHGLVLFLRVRLLACVGSCPSFQVYSSTFEHILK